MAPEWYGKRYPTIQDVEDYAESIGVAIRYGPFPAAFLPTEDGGPVVFLPEGLEDLERAWLMVHEIGHMLYHASPSGRMNGKREFRADSWAACALLPIDRILAHQNASEDAFIAALSAHYQDIPFRDCKARTIAAEIASVRLRALSQEVA